jgi:hypothetical protein
MLVLMSFRIELDVEIGDAAEDEAQGPQVSMQIRSVSDERRLQLFKQAGIEEHDGLITIELLVKVGVPAAPPSVRRPSGLPPRTASQHSAWRVV